MSCLVLLLLQLIAISAINSTELTVRANYFVSDDRFLYQPTFDDRVQCNCTVLNIENLKTLREFMGIAVINGTIGELQEGDVSDLPNLRELSFSTTEIGKIAPRSFNNLPSLRYLFLDDNRLRKIANGTFQQFHQLLVLSLRGNRLKRIEGGVFAEMSSLTELDLSQNRLSKINGEWFRDLNLLESLNLSGNKVTVVPDSVFTHLKSLQELNLARNSIRTLESGSLRGLSNLNVLDLSNNRLFSLREDVFREQEYALRELFICGHPLECNSELKFRALFKNLEVLVIREQINCTHRLDISQMVVYFYRQKRYFWYKSIVHTLRDKRFPYINFGC